ncbi:MAG: hypothetical protein CVV41_10395 [Candidatus Riflebacteria bacterium HGW-Riflebacteria-1]|nr:MAG: hypothetical protein CVV41_10395 [Candidatus Riflebacteria bacterium HGW-Riflebacteria-1]
MGNVMDCRNVKELFSEYIDGSLGEIERKALENHLENCANCRAECDSLLDSWEMLTDFAVPPVGDQFTRQVMQKVNNRSSQPVVSDWFSRLVAIFSLRQISAVPALASLVVLIGIGYFILSGRPAGIAERNGIDSTRKFEVVRDLRDEEIIRDLEIYENAEILENLDLLMDLEAVESFEAAD